MQEQILDALRRGAHEEALVLAREAAAEDPRSARAHLWLAMASSAAGADDDAMAAVERGIALEPEDADLHLQLATLLLRRQDVDTARASLSQAVSLDPNQFGAHILQAQLAISAGDVDEAARLGRLAARIAPDHPWVAMIDGIVASRQGRHDEALKHLTRASEQEPDDAQVLHALGFAYLANGHLAFAEQVFRKLLDTAGSSTTLRVLLAQVLQRQQRPGEAVEVLQPLLESSTQATPALQRFNGRLELMANRPDRALPWLRAALAADPGDQETLEALLETWRRTEDIDNARSTLEAALATTTTQRVLWQARLALEEAGTEAAEAVVGRWNHAMPEDVAALEARMFALLRRGEADAARHEASRIIEQMPGHATAQDLIVQELVQRDPAAAAHHVAALLAQARTPASRLALTEWLARVEDAAGKYADAARHWGEAAELRIPSSRPLPPVSRNPAEVAAGAWPEWRVATDDRQQIETLFLWGAPGSCVENIASILGAISAFRADRFTSSAPLDAFQRYASIEELSSLALSGEQSLQEWRSALPSRGIAGEHVIDWLVWWDNALLRVLRPHLPHAALLFVLRDPRDMLLQWLAHGSHGRMAIPSPRLAGAWMARVLGQVSDVMEQRLFRGVLLKIDGIEDDATKLAERLSEVPGLQVSPVGRPLRHPFPSGHWRNYAEALAEPFAMLTPVAVRLGYPET